MQNTDNLCMGCMSEKTEDAVCPVCGFDESSYNEPDALKMRTVIAERYLVGKVISSHGGGFTYLGFDLETDSVITVREYFPVGFCNRAKDGSVVVDNENSFVFNEGLLKFIELYKTLSTLENIGAVYPVIDLFETGNTAYSVNEYFPGITLKEFLLRNGGSLKWEQVRPLFLPLIGAIKALHSAGIIHGGISPETLIVGRDGRIRINEFCIAAIRNAKSNMTSQLFPGYAALEQYEGGDLSPATDVYSFAATVFRALTGNAPADALTRLEKDNITFPKSVAEELPKGVLIALANALQLREEDRTKTIDGFKENLESSEDLMSSGPSQKDFQEQERQKNISTKKYTVIAAVATACILAVIALILYLFVFRHSASEKPSSSNFSAPSTVSVGDIGNSQKPESLFSVPDFSNQTYASLISNDEYKKWFVFSVVKKEYSDKVEKGKVCGQSVAVGTSVKRDTKVELTISLGPKMLTLSKKLEGMTKEQAYIKLLELGFEPDNIEFIEKMSSTPTEEQIILEASPALGEKVSPDDFITLYYNSNIKVESSEPTPSAESENMPSVSE